MHLNSNAENLEIFVFKNSIKPTGLLTLTSGLSEFSIGNIVLYHGGTLSYTNELLSKC